MDPNALATRLAAGRIVLGTGLAFLPDRLTGPWVGGAEALRPGAQVLGPAMGSRDLAIGLGTLTAVRRGSGARPWLLASAAGDVADLLATLRNRSDLPFLGVAGVAFMAATSAALNAYLATALD